MPKTSSHPEIVLPASTLSVLRAELIDALGAEAGAKALQRAGYAAGNALYDIESRSDPGSGDLADAPQNVFWARIGELFSARGWGRLEFDDAHPGVGALQSSDWAEASRTENTRHPCCFFTVGLLANLLGRVSGETVSVLESECRGAGDPVCRFLFGSPAAMDAVFRELEAGQPPTDVLESVGA